MSWFSELIPFLEPYPTWVKALISGWVLLTAVCVIALLVGRPAAAHAATPPATDEVWLEIKGVEVFDEGLRRACVRVTAKVNDNEFQYPSVGEARWMQVGQVMSPARFKLPSSPSAVYHVAFAMVAIADAQDESSEAQFISQETRLVHKDRLPSPGSYPLHRLAHSPQASSIAAQISYEISNRPD